MATETTYPSTSLQVSLHKINGNTLGHLGSRRDKARLLWLRQLPWPALQVRPQTTTGKSSGKHSKFSSFANEKSMRLIEAIKIIRTSYKLNLLAVFVCLALVESTAFANQLLQNDPQQHYHQQHQQQIRRIFDHLESQKKQQNEQHLSQLANLVRSAEQHQQSPPEEHLSRQDRLIAEQPVRGAYGQPLALSEEQQQSLWTSSDLFITPQTSGKQDQFNGPSEYSRQQTGQYFAYRPLSALPANGPITTPPMSRQIMGPPQFYEFALSPTNAVQLEQVSGEDREGSAATAPIAAASLRANGAKSMANPNNQADNQAEGSNAVGVVARNPGQQADQSNSNREQNDSSPSKAQDEPSSGGNNAQDASSAGSNQEQAAGQQAVDKTIEPRQRRRIFNRILKKAEWNHLFVELSKVFLRYFLDLALKDIIGKQSGSTDTTTSRKKLDAQSELADLLKDFVKTAISNI